MVGALQGQDVLPERVLAPHLPVPGPSWDFQHGRRGGAGAVTPRQQEQLDFSNISEEKQAKVIKYHFPALFCSIFHPSDTARAPFPSLFHPELQEIWDSLKGISAESA